MDETEARFRWLERRVQALDMVVSGVFMRMLKDGVVPPGYFRMVAETFDRSAGETRSTRQQADDKAIADLARTILAMADAPHFTSDLRLVHDADRDPPLDER